MTKGIIKDKLAEFSDELILSEVQRLAHLGFFLLEWPAGKAEFSEEGKKILEFNKGRSIQNTRKFIDSMEPVDAIRFSSMLEDSVLNIDQFNLEFQIRTLENHTKTIHSIGHPVSEHRGKSKIFGTLLDITARKEAERALFDEKERTQMILDTCASFIIMVGDDKKVKLINHTGCEILGLPEREIIGKNWFSNFIPANQRKGVKDSFRRLMSGETGETKFIENRILASQGTELRWIEWHNTVMKDDDNKPVGILSSGIDITKRKKAEKMKMEAVIEGEERERQRVANELHDGLMQVLSAISLNLKAIENEAEKLPEVKKKAYRNALELIGTALSDTRSISHRMMPRDLERFGLNDAMVNLCESINQSSTLKINFIYKGLRKKLNKKFEVILFRISQELVNNILKHSKADLAEIRFHQKKTRFLIQVKDNGVGYTSNKNRKSADGIGLQNIATRVRSFNGTLSIQGKNGKGTLIKIMIPID